MAVVAPCGSTGAEITQVTSCLSQAVCPEEARDKFLSFATACSEFEDESLPQPAAAGAPAAYRPGLLEQWCSCGSCGGWCTRRKSPPLPQALPNLKQAKMKRPSWLPRALSLSTHEEEDEGALLPGQVNEGEEAASEKVKEFDAGFVQASVRDLEEWPWLEVRIVTSDGAVDQDNLSRMLDFVWETLSSERAAKGLRLTYDLRRLRYPKMNVVIAIAQWGSEPRRQVMFQERVVACSICVNAGFKFKVAKTAMSAFFKVCPPTCRTYVVTDLEGGASAGGDVAIFEKPGGSDPPPEAPTAADGGEKPTEPLELELEKRVSEVVHRKSSADEAPAPAPAARPRGGGCGGCLAGLFGGRRRPTGSQPGPGARSRSSTADPELVRTVQELQRTIDAMTERIAQLERK